MVVVVMNLRFIALAVIDPKLLGTVIMMYPMEFTFSLIGSILGSYLAVWFVGKVRNWWKGRKDEDE